MKLESNQRSFNRIFTCKILLTLVLLLCLPHLASAQPSIRDTLILNFESVVRVGDVVQGVVKARPGKLRVMRYVSEGGGFVIDKSGIIVTNRHVVKGKGRLNVVLHNGVKKKARIIGMSARYDLAFLKIDGGRKLKALKFADEVNVHLGDTVYAIGSSDATYGTIKQGQVTGIGHSKENVSDKRQEIIQVNFNAYVGDSGSPIFDSEGNLIGMMTATSKSEDRVSYAIPISYIREAYLIVKKKSGL